MLEYSNTKKTNAAIMSSNQKPESPAVINEVRKQPNHAEWKKASPDNEYFASLCFREMCRVQNQICKNLHNCWVVFLVMIRNAIRLIT